MYNYTLNDISIYIPTYDRPEFLKKSIESLVSQTAGIPKITVFNNGTMKEVSDVINSFKDYGVVEYKSSGGLLECMDKVSETIDTKYVMFFHDDDILNCKYLEYAIKALNKYDNIAFITTVTKDFTKENQIDFEPAEEEHYLFESQEEFSKFMYINEKIAMQTAIYRSDLFKKFPRENDKYGKFFDWPYLVTLSAHGNVVLFNDDNIFNVRIHKGQWTNDEKSSWTVDSLIKWHKQFFEAMKADVENSEAHYIFYSKFNYFFSGAYLGLICDKFKKECSLSNALKLALKEIGLDKNDQMYGKTYFVAPLQKISRQNNFVNDFESEKANKALNIEKLLLEATLDNFNMRIYALNERIYRLESRFSFKNFIQNIFSLRNKDNHKILKILGFKFKFRRKKK